MRKLGLRITLCVFAAAIFAGIWFSYRWYLAGHPVRWSYWTPAVQQTDNASVVGEGVTMLATPEKDLSSNLDFEVTGLPLKVKITPAAFEGRYVSLRFSALTDYEVVFKPPFYSQLVAVLDQYDTLKERVIQQKRLKYIQQLASIPYVDRNGRVQSIRVSLRSSPRQSVVSHGINTDEGQTIYLQLDLPFPLEQSNNFDHTEVYIPDDGVRHLRDILEHFIHNAPTRLQTV